MSESAPTLAAPDPAAAATSPPAPADLAPQPRTWERFAWYAGSMLLSLVLVLAGMRVDRLDWYAPTYYNLDSLLYLTVTRSTLENGLGGHWHNPRMGVPWEQELYDFPIIDHLHFATFRLLAVFVPEPSVADPDSAAPGPRTRKLLLVYNLSSFLTYPLTVLTSMWAFRVLKLSLPAAAVGGLLYAFLPYHQERLQYHYFLAAYWVVPLSLLPALAICRGEFPFFRKTSDGTLRWQLLSRNTVLLVLLTAAVPSAGAYYAFFTCAVYAFAGLFGAIVSRTWRAGAAAGILIGLVIAFGLLNHLPAFLYRANHGTNPITERHSWEAEHYALKLSHLVLPQLEHRLDLFSRMRAQYTTVDRPGEGEIAGSLGCLGVAGCIGLISLAVLPFRRGWPEGPLAGLLIFLVLLATLGGFGAVFNLLVTAEIRAYNRISVFIAFVCQFAALWWLDRFLLTRTTPRAQKLRYPAWAAVLLLGFLDQTPSSWFGPRIVADIDKYAERFRADARFFTRVEKAFPGATVFCLPYIPFPEVPPMYKMEAYEHARGYVMTDTLTWSFGAVKGREADTWQQEVAGHVHRGNVKEMLKRIVARGFDAVFIDARGFPPARDPKDTGGPLTAKEVIDYINQAYADELGRKVAALPEVVHESQNQFFLDLRPFRDAYRARNPEAFEDLVRREREWVAVLWLGRFSSPEPFGYADKLRFGPPDGTIMFVNPSNHTRTFRLSMLFGVETPGVFHLRLSGLVDDDFEIEKGPGDWLARRYGVSRSYTVELPPGRSTIRIRCTPPPDFTPRDSRKQCYFLMGFHKQEG